MMNDILGKLVADKYRIETLLSENESGDLFLGQHEVLGKPVTVKILPASQSANSRAVRRFVDESRTASAITHPNVLNLTDFGTDAKDVSYAVFEPAHGKTLREMMLGEPAFDEKRALTISRQIAAALLAAHSKKIIHGRLSPKGVFVDNTDGGDSVKILGFGGDPLDVDRDADPQYLSPEQCTAFPAASERSDVYALGVMLYEMLSGVVPFDGSNAADVMAKQSTEPPPPLSAFRRDLHPEIEPIVLSAIAGDPERRYQSMEAFAEDLEIVSGRIGTPSKAAVAAGNAPKRNVWQTAFIALAGIALLAVALIYATSVRRTDPTTQMQADAGSLPVQPIGPATGAQEESLARLPTMTDAEIMAAGNSNSAMSMDTMPGGDGYNAWANGGAPPAGAPLQNYIPPGGQVYTIDPNTGSPFMPNDGVILVPVPTNTNTSPKSTPTPKTAPANTVPQPTPLPASTPKPMATPPKNTKPGTEQPVKGKPTPGGKTTRNGVQEDIN